MMDNEIVIVGENMMMGPKWFLKFCLRNHFHENIKQFKKYCHGMNVNPLPPPTQSLLTTLYIYLVKIGVPWK
jgi:hypothetical protein